MAYRRRRYYSRRKYAYRKYRTRAVYRRRAYRPRYRRRRYVGKRKTYKKAPASVGILTNGLPILSRPMIKIGHEAEVFEQAAQVHKQASDEAQMITRAKSKL